LIDAAMVFKIEFGWPRRNWSIELSPPFCYLFFC
jgi:hypothetical protein